MAIIKLKDGFEVKPGGFYVFQVKKIDVRTAEKGPNAGNTFLAWEDLILESPDHPELVGDKYSHTTPVGCSPRSKYYPLFEALGYGIPDGSKEMELDTDDLIDKEFVAEVIVTKVNDQERNEFKAVWSIESFAQRQSKSEALRNKLAGGTSSAAPERQSTPPPVNTVFNASKSSTILGGESKNTAINTGEKRLSTFPT